jgi:hypothetical protein
LGFLGAHFGARSNSCASLKLTATGAALAARSFAVAARSVAPLPRQNPLTRQ